MLEFVLSLHIHNLPYILRQKDVLEKVPFQHSPGLPEKLGFNPYKNGFVVVPFEGRQIKVGSYIAGMSRETQFLPNF